MPFIYFEYYPTSMFDEDGPNKAMLDAVVSDRPVLCQDFGEHLCWVNSRMLELMGVDKNTPDPSKLEIFVRDENGETYRLDKGAGMETLHRQCVRCSRLETA